MAAERHAAADRSSDLEGTAPLSSTLDGRPLTTGVLDLLDVAVEELGPSRVVLAMPVTSRAHQPLGLLHGGISALLAESAASFGAAVSAPAGSRVVGIELNASHLRPMTHGVLRATATPLRQGRSVQVWAIALEDHEGRSICAARCTVAVRAQPEEDAGS